jgi:competence protein ComGC
MAKVSKMKRKKAKGFTLIELLVVVSNVHTYRLLKNTKKTVSGL